jgi:PAS domain S-box-containing protein
MPRIFREKKWSETKLGDVDTWPQSLKTAVSIMLESQFPMFIAWGEKRVFLYNDAYSVILTNKHPQALGKEFPEVWPEAWAELSLLVAAVDRGEAMFIEDYPLFLTRNGVNEEGFFTFSYSPIRDEADAVAGLLCSCVETTGRIKAERQLKSERQKVEQNLTQENTRLLNLLENIPGSVAYLTGPGHILSFANSQYKNVFLGGRDVVGTAIEKLLPEAGKQGFIVLLNQVYATGERFEGKGLPFEYARPDGSQKKVFVDFVYEAVRNSENKIEGILAVIFDVTDVVVASGKLSESAEALKLEKQKVDSLIAESTSAIGLMRGPDLRFELVNKKWRRLVGPREYIGRTYAEVYPELIDTPAHKSHIEIFKTGIPFIANEMKLLVTSPSGVLEDQYYDYTNIRIMGVDGKPYGVYCNALNVTDRVKAREKLRQSEERLQLALAAGRMGTWALSLATYDIITSDETKKLFGVEELAENVYELINSRMHPDDTAEVANALDDAIASKNPYKHEYRIILPATGEVKWILSQGTARYAKDGTPTEITGIVVDITERKNAENDLINAKNEAERANRLKSAFLANMSHEIRTPLGAMIGFADLLRDPSLSNVQRSNYIDILSRNGESLAVIINDILDLSKVEAGHLTLEYTDTYVPEIVEDVISLLRVKAKEKSLSLEYQADESTPQKIIADSVRVRQVLLNLVGNAIKFTQFGSVTIRTYGRKTGTNDSLCVEITDTGIGIPVGEKENIFKMFVQADGSTTRRFGGTGLGLALSRELARAMGGDVVVTKTSLGRGTTFLVTIKDQPELRTIESVATKAEKKTRAETASNSLEGIKVLVVDDSPDNQKLIWHYLSKQGATVDTADNGSIGVQKALAGDYDIVLMDIQMPEMDGYTATQKLRNAGYMTPIIALTAHAMSEVRDKVLNVGANAHLPKPINAKELIAAIAAHVHS